MISTQLYHLFHTFLNKFVCLLHYCHSEFIVKHINIIIKIAYLTETEQIQLVNRFTSDVMYSL
jgi:hypothetical protein